MNKMNLIDINFKNLSISEKRVAFVLMDLMMKKLHEKDMTVASFEPSKIYFEDGYYYFDEIKPITNYNFDSKNSAILGNSLQLANLAFCSYLADYDLTHGLLNQEVIYNHYSDFETNFPEEDRKFYKMILVDSYGKHQLVGESPYYYDYVLKNQSSNSKNTNSSSHNMAYIKATEAGRAFASQDNEAAFSSRFFLITAVVAFIILLVGLILGFLGYFG